MTGERENGRSWWFTANGKVIELVLLPRSNYPDWCGDESSGHPKNQDRKPPENHHYQPPEELAPSPIGRHKPEPTL